MKLDTRKPLPSITIVGAWQEPNRVEILFHHPNNTLYRAVAWLDAKCPHPVGNISHVYWFHSTETPDSAPYSY